MKTACSAEKSQWVEIVLLPEHSNCMFVTLDSTSSLSVLTVQNRSVAQDDLYVYRYLDTFRHILMSC